MTRTVFALPRMSRQPRPRQFVYAIAAFVLASALLLSGCARPATQTPLTVFAAASLKESMDQAATLYGETTGQPVRVSYAGSSALARQIEQGAPADVFVSADLDWMDALQDKGLADTATRTDLLGNTLVLVAPKGSAAAAVQLHGGIDLLPLLGNDGRIAMALTDSVPAGKYAKAALQSLGMWRALQARTAEAENVRAALLMVARTETPIGVVYGSDAKAEPRVKVLGIFPADSHPPIVYPAARLARSTHAQGADFVQWLQTPAAAKIFRAHGFETR